MIGWIRLVFRKVFLPFILVNLNIGWRKDWLILPNTIYVYAIKRNFQNNAT